LEKDAILSHFKVSSYRKKVTCQCHLAYFWKKHTFLARNRARLKIVHFRILLWCR